MFITNPPYNCILTLKQDNTILVEELGKLCKWGMGKCWICDCQKHRRGMVIHHRWYLKKGDVIYRNEEYLPHNDSNRNRYLKDLLVMVKRNPNRFMYLCNPDHHALGKFCQYGDKKFNKICIARKMTKKV